MSRFRSKNAYGQWSHPRGAGGRFTSAKLSTGTKIAAKAGFKSAQGKVAEHKKRQVKAALARDTREWHAAGRLVKLQGGTPLPLSDPRVAGQRAAGRAQIRSQLGARQVRR